VELSDVPILKELHHRMPMILDPDTYSKWLDSDNRKTDSLSEILHNRSITDLVFHAVAKQVNFVANNAPSNIKPIQTEFEF
jgi:putative SOS response-associated peptidase YedK